MSGVSGGFVLGARLEAASTPLEQNSFGIWEPVDGELISPRNLDIAITPTVAFDKNNNRIGMGGGYFDRCFAYLRHRHLWFRPKLIGVAFACQEVEEIRPNPWDIRLYTVFSDANLCFLPATVATYGTQSCNTNSF